MQPPSPPLLNNSDLVDVVGVTPVPSPAPSSEEDTRQEMAEEEDSPTKEGDEDGGKIRCICGNEEDDGFTIQCDSCLIWQHARCVGIVRNNVPEVYLCEECRPPEDVDIEVSILLLQLVN